MAEKSSPAALPVGCEFNFTRVFDAPRELVFRVWTQREHLIQWWGPKGCKVGTCKIDLHPGGVFHYSMRTPEGRDVWGKWVFREVTVPERLVFWASFSDEAGGITRHPLSPEWPAEVLSILTFSENAGKTTLTLRWTPHNATEAERKTFEAARDSMRAGWTGTMDQLAEYLEKLLIRN